MTEQEKRQHRCCFTGHRPEKLNIPEAEVKAWLSDQIDSAISAGYTTFISGISSNEAMTDKHKDFRLMNCQFLCYYKKDYRYL